MKTNIIRWTAAAGFAVAAFSGGANFAEPAHAAESAHPDFAWWPTAKPGNRLYVGGLSGNIGSSDVSIYYNPKELTIDKQVPWQK